ncbi:MAG: hypothetical protein ACR2GM_07420 [Nocardioidaceae bacterium]
MAIAELRGNAKTEGGGLRDPLASDIDDRLVVRSPSPEVIENSPDRRTWPTPRRRRRLPAGWPIAAAVAGWPLWWALGVTNLVFPLFAAPLAWQLVKRRNIRLPSGFWLWALFLVLVVVSGFAIDVEVAGTATSTGVGRYFALTSRLLNYVAVTVMLLYVGNASEEELPRRRLISWIAFLGVFAVGLGTLAVFLPTFGFPTAMSAILPESLLGGGDGGQARLAQVQPVLGETSPRPSAPFAYTNAWGNNVSLLLVWVVVAWSALGSRRRQVALWVLLAVAMVPIVYSLNRGMWIGLGISFVVVAVRLALRGRVMVLAGMLMLITVASLAFVVSPLQTMVQARLDEGHSNEVRGSLAGEAVAAARQSPVIGFGSTRQTLGSDSSIAVGPSDDCPRCGGRDIGSTGQLTLLLIAHGFVGVGLYCGFLIRSVWAYANDHSVLGIAGTLVVGLDLFYALFYSALTMPLAITFLSIGLLWRNQQLRIAAGHA